MLAAIEYTVEKGPLNATIRIDREDTEARVVAFAPSASEREQAPASFAVKAKVRPAEAHRLRRCQLELKRRPLCKYLHCYACIDIRAVKSESRSATCREKAAGIS